MGRGPAWTRNDLKHLREMVALGMTDVQIAEQMGRGVQSIASMRWREKIKRRRVIKMTPQAMAAIELARSRGMTWKQIGVAAGFNSATLAAHYRKAVRAQESATAHTE